MDSEANAFFLFIVLVLCWCWALDRFTPQSLDRDDMERSRVNAGGGSRRRGAHQNRDDPECEISLDRICQHGGEIAAHLVLIEGADPDFSLDQFIAGGERAYETVVTAFAKGDRHLLRDLVSEHVYEIFSRILDERDERGEWVEMAFVALDNPVVTDVDVLDGRAEITVDFGAELVTATRNKTGMVVSGDPTKVLKVSDRWTFIRNLGSHASSWRVAATESVIDHLKMKR